MFTSFLEVTASFLEVITRAEGALTRAGQVRGPKRLDIASLSLAHMLGNSGAPMNSQSFLEVIATRDVQRELDHLVRHSIQQRSATPN